MVRPGHLHPRRRASGKPVDAGPASGLRDLRDDPKRAELIRKLARERVERKKRAMDEAGGRR